MADPTIYEPGYDFTATDKGASLNNELNGIAASLQSVADALADVRRSDGNLKNQIVKKEALDPLAMAALSDELSADLAEQLETALATASASATAAAGSAATAATNNTNAQTAATDATAAAVAAAASASSATGSAVSAAASAASAAADADVAGGAADAASVAAVAAESSATAAAASATALANSRIVFSARKSADQTGILTATATKLTFPTEVLDFGGFYDAANSRFTPSSGRYRIAAGASWSAGLVDGRQVTVEIWKNGTVFRVFGTQVSGTTDAALVSGACIVEANGTDYFEVYGTGFGVGNKTVAGGVSVTYFEGEAI